MKRAITRISIVAAACASIIACSPKQENQTPNAQAQQRVTVQAATTTINLPTMKCKMCAGTITDALNKIDGVKDVKVDVDAKTAVVMYEPVKIDQRKIETTISDAGYDANLTKRTDAGYSQLAECCK